MATGVEFDSERAFGSEWWQQLAAYGFTRAIDAEFVAPPQANRDDNGALNRAPNGQYFTRGQSAQAGLMQDKTLMIVGAGILAAALAFAVLKG